MQATTKTTFSRVSRKSIANRERSILAHFLRGSTMNTTVVSTNPPLTTPQSMFEQQPLCSKGFIFIVSFPPTYKHFLSLPFTSFPSLPFPSFHFTSQSFPLDLRPFPPRLPFPFCAHPRDSSYNRYPHIRSAQATKLYGATTGSDMLKTKIPESWEPGRYIVQWRWGPYIDCIDVDVLPPSHANNGSDPLQKCVRTGIFVFC